MILDYEIATFIAIVAIVLIAGTVKVTLGVGFALIATPLLLLVMDAGDVVGFIVPLILLQDLIILRQTWRQIQWRSAAILAVSAVIVAPFASLLHTALNADALRVVISLTIITAGVVLLSGVKFTIPCPGGSRGHQRRSLPPCWDLRATCCAVPGEPTLGDGGDAGSPCCLSGGA